MHEKELIAELEWMPPRRDADASQTRARSDESPRDIALSTRVLKAIRDLQAALDGAACAGLIIEPSLKRYPDRFRELGSDVESYVVTVEIYRKLV